MSLLATWRFERALKALSRTDEPICQHYAAAPWPAREMLASEAPLLALDFELDGLGKDAHLLQAGWVSLNGRSITLSEAHSRDIRSTAELNDEAVTIHGIGEQRAAKGTLLKDVMRELIGELAGRVIIAHAAAIEHSAIVRSVRAVFGVQLPVRCICTMMLERQINPNQVGQEAYRLGPTRARYGLPEYDAHDALTDAIAAAELFQAQLTRLPSDTTLDDLES